MKAANTLVHITGITTLLLGASPTLASDAETSAVASASPWGRAGRAAATAAYEGDIGFARTRADSGRVSLARGVAVGVDQDGLALSVSHAVATPFGAAVGANFNFSIGRDGRIAARRQLALRRGLFASAVRVGGHAGTGRPIFAPPGRHAGCALFKRRSHHRTHVRIVRRKVRRVYLLPRPH